MDSIKTHEFHAFLSAELAGKARIDVAQLFLKVFLNIAWNLKIGLELNVAGIQSIIEA